VYNSKIIYHSNRPGRPDAFVKKIAQSVAQSVA
jgi:hypothetical protein